ncbi:hypothetical protein JR316_0008545 [Psilocybe cubensis]|uniref:Uncharacterized protein n=1 Tax=Psilocybe cubensis TaxID=181762 RepID=A0ACB8GWD6_PSICU|nr:hypothetical protein JR316_0008545 [Psilocybe cubensis]KAH9479948.1 hypothetical protein JR316_0008545 [Psilocybe cubensis]
MRSGPMTLECKRRKIKCDRTQPCAPCTRRGEEAGCQWHIVEPVEKYATKAEFDELKARFEQLAAFVQRLMPPPGGQPFFPLGVQAAMPGVAGEAVQLFNSPATSNPMGYPTLMPPPQPPQQQQTYSQHMETSSLASSRYVKPEGAQSPTRHQQHQSVSGPVPSAGSASSGLHSNPPSHPRHRAETSPSTAAATLKSSPLSLSVITSPFNRPEPTSSASSSQPTATEIQSKNFHAQTLMLGERLRPGSEDPVIFFVKTRARIADMFHDNTATAPSGTVSPSAYNPQQSMLARRTSDHEPLARPLLLPAREDERTRKSMYHSANRDR